MLNGDMVGAAAYAVEIMELREASAQAVSVVESLDPEEQIKAYWTWTLAYQSGAPSPNRVEIAFAHTALGNLDAAFSALEQALEAHDSSLLFLGFDPRYDALRGDPRFQRIAVAVGVPGVIR